MRGWIILALIAGGLYYLYTETDKLDEPIAETQMVLKKIERKLDSLTGTQIIRVDGRLQKLKAEIGQRLTAAELSEFDAVLTDKNSVMDFKESYCEKSGVSHPVFDKENLLFICDNL
ncbi:conserved hypothetical protein [Shewanella amazonensis SB2B]|uniref:Uncharacterized protein n=1 Tax=Shewanella amazonensis (strain ATCC BAA-1098 / SB2B) TaxID=326297 RepID=A1SBT0_SHEAM|nr:hypothetical protein [Shewanella amazonensis]ABM01837.1 conserved hypothetical protein [Shewanella amazonensis SB2B]